MAINDATTHIMSFKFQVKRLLTYTTQRLTTGDRDLVRRHLQHITLIIVKIRRLVLLSFWSSPRYRNLAEIKVLSSGSKGAGPDSVTGDPPPVLHLLFCLHFLNKAGMLRHLLDKAKVYLYARPVT